jgi:hypothetical protein
MLERMLAVVELEFES